MAIVWNHCKTKMVCEADEPKEEGENPDNDETKKGHGGCGHVQPQIRKEGLKLYAQYKKSKDDDEVCLHHILPPPSLILPCVRRTRSRRSRTSDYSRLKTFITRSKKCQILTSISLAYRTSMRDPSG
jgi:DNA-directed RNA polymerase II subunit RPB1